jgi:hypothetical protein
VQRFETVRHIFRGTFAADEPVLTGPRRLPTNTTITYIVGNSQVTLFIMS